jgi:hypothetical protein
VYVYELVYEIRGRMHELVLAARLACMPGKGMCAYIFVPELRTVPVDNRVQKAQKVPECSREDKASIQI